MDTKLLVLCILCASVYNVKAQGSCTTPGRTEGTCINISDCEPLFSLLRNKNRSQTDTQLLRDSQCGRTGSYPRVCCPRPQPGCTNGARCVGIFSCPRLLALLDTRPVPARAQQILRGATCTGRERFSVCCPEESVPATEPSVTSAPSIETKINVSTLQARGLLPAKESCGRSGGEDKIFGGSETELDQYPWMAMVEYATKSNTVVPACGGSLISKRYVVTAGHCVKGRVLKDLGRPIRVRLGEWDTATDVDCVEIDNEKDCNDPPVTVKIEQVISHPQYLLTPTSDQKNDIALLRLERDVQFTFFIRPVCLPADDITRDASPELLVVAGWGSTEAGRPKNKKLHVSLPLVDLQSCQKAYDDRRLGANLWDNQICAGGEADRDSCRGDSGGPLMGSRSSPTGPQQELHGVVSFGPTKCATTGVPGIYTKVRAYLPWIYSQLRL